MPFLEAAGRRLEVERVPGSGGPALVFLHEGLGCAAAWRDFPRAVAEATGLPALVYSRAGYGRSDPAPLPRGVGFMHDEALQVLPDLLARAEIDDAILVGHSDGASIALIYAGAIGRRVRGLVLLAPHVFVEEVCVTSIARLRAAYPGDELREKLARRHDDPDATFYGWTDVWLHPDFRRWSIEELLPGVRAPALVIQGDADEYGTLAQVDAVCAWIAAPAERLILPGAGHAPHKDRPEETLAAVTRFVRGLLDGPVHSGGPIGP
jgi:pimeloyl-ACP methyl ester carboxylesterase